MDRPRICELLGVEPMEEWTMPGVSGRYRITESGNVEYKRGDDWGPLVTGYVETKFIRALNHPGDIKQARWTKEDIQGAKIIRSLCPGIVSVTKEGNTDRNSYIGEGSWSFTVGADPGKVLLPSLKEGETVNLSEILEDEDWI